MLGRRARRIGLEPVRLIDTGERDASRHALVMLSGRAPVLADWTLAAIVDHRDGHVAVRPVGEQGERAAAQRRERTRHHVVKGCAERRSRALQAHERAVASVSTKRRRARRDVLLWTKSGSHDGAAENVALIEIQQSRAQPARRCPRRCRL